MPCEDDIAADRDHEILPQELLRYLQGTSGYEQVLESLRNADCIVVRCDPDRGEIEMIDIDFGCRVLCVIGKCPKRMYENHRSQQPQATRDGDGSMEAELLSLAGASLEAEGARNLLTEAALLSQGYKGDDTLCSTFSIHIPPSSFPRLKYLDRHTGNCTKHHDL